MRQLFSQMWNQRKANVWVWFTLFIVGLLTWYGIDVIYNYEVSSARPLGYAIDGVYNVELRYNWTKEDGLATMDDDNRIIYNRIKDYPGVEQACFYYGDTPFTDARMYEGYCTHTDSSRTVSTYIRYTSPEFFEVFGIEPLCGSIDTDRWRSGEYPVPVIVTEEFADSLFGGATQAVGQTMFNPYWHASGTSTNYRIMAVVANEKSSEYSRYEPMIYHPADIEALGYSNITVKASPGFRHGFESRFNADMREPLERGVFYLLGAQALSDMESEYSLTHGTVSYLRALYWFIAFFMFTVFLVVTGTFMLKVRRRRSEIALRMAAGSSRYGIAAMLVKEGLLLLALAMLPVAVVAANVVYADLTVNTLTEMSAIRFIVGILVAWLLLALVIVAAILPSAYRATRLSPAEALRDE